MNTVKAVMALPLNFVIFKNVLPVREFTGKGFTVFTGVRKINVYVADM